LAPPQSKPFLPDKPRFLLLLGLLCGQSVGPTAAAKDGNDRQAFRESEDLQPFPTLAA
jgi:hypothetical protein